MTTQPALDAFGRGIEARVRPDDPGVLVVFENALQRRFVAVRMQVEPSFHGQVDDPAHDVAPGVVTEHVKLTDAAITAAGELGLDERQGPDIAKPGRTISVAPI